MSPSKYIEKHNVAVLDEHEIKDKDGKTLAKIDAKKLQHIADVNNQRIKDTGDLIPLVIGHTKGEVGEYVPEDQQPEIVGYAKNLRVGQFKNTNRKAIHATFQFFKDKLDKVRNFPRRSVELWLSDWKIDPISLLGATTPERDLGLLQLSRGGKKVIKRTLNSPLKFNKVETVPMDNEKLVQEVLAALMQSDLFKFLQKLKDEVEGGGEEEGPDAGGPEMEGDEGVPPSDELDMQGEEGNEPVEEEEPEAEPERYSSVASGSNTYTTTFGGGPMKKVKHSKGQTPAPADRETRIRMSRLEKANRGLQEAYEGLRIRYQASEREKDLLTLQSAGYDFDINEELEWLAPLPDEQYEYHFNRLRKRYAKSPVGVDLGLEHTVARSPFGGAQGRNKEQAMQIAEMARKKGISYEDALKELD